MGTRRSKYLPPKTEEELRAERKFRRDRRKLWATNPTEARRIERQEWDEQDKRNEAIMVKYRSRQDEVLSLLPKYLTFSFFGCPTKYYPDAQGGKLTCKVCGKTYQWQEWGRPETAGCTHMAEHLFKEHPKEFEAAGCIIRPKIELVMWKEAQYKKLREEGK
jgi:hypothetical protein